MREMVPTDDHTNAPGATMERRVRLDRDGDIGVLTFDNPPVNAVSAEVIVDLAAALEAYDADPSLIGLVVRGAGSSFVAGGDIRIFDDPAFTAKPINTLLARIEANDRPAVAALHGSALGGGLEIAMACHYRVAAPETRLGLPEVTLGLIPGSLGTQRLPRLTSLTLAADMISTGKPIKSDAALRAGLIDDIAEDPLTVAKAACRQIANANADLRRASTLPVRDAADVEVLLAPLERNAAAKPYLPALSAVARSLRAAATKPWAEGEATEARAFAALVPSPQSRALRHVFLAERAARHIPDLPADTTPRPVERIGVLGAGTMGTGIAMAFSDAGFPVMLVDASEAGLKRGLGLIDKAYAGSVKRGRLTEEQAAALRGRITGSLEVEALSDADMIVEAVFEDMALKQRVMAKLGTIAKPGAVIASNTSTLDIDVLARASGCPGDVVGTHFFSPAQIMRLLEIVRGAETAPDVLATVMTVARAIGKTAVVSGVCYGFIGNRMAEVYMRESEAMQLEGASPAEIDGVVESPDWIGMAMGPSRMLDMAGVDVGARTVIEWIKSGDGPQHPAYRILCRTLNDAGRHGQKTGHGYYRYEGRDALPSAETAALAARLAAEHGIARRNAIPKQEIFERLLYAMVNEAALILQEGVAARPSDIDVVWTAGYGFPAWRGGPLFMADEIGAGEIVARLEHYAQALGNADGRWTVAPLLRTLAANDGRFADLT